MPIKRDKSTDKTSNAMFGNTIRIYVAAAIYRQTAGGAATVTARGIEEDWGLRYAPVQTDFGRLESAELLFDEGKDENNRTIMRPADTHYWEACDLILRGLQDPEDALRDY